MVPAPVYVEQMQMSHLPDPENKIGVLGWGTSLKRRNVENDTETQKMIVAPPGE